MTSSTIFSAILVRPPHLDVCRPRLSMMPDGVFHLVVGKGKGRGFLLAGAVQGALATPNVLVHWSLASFWPRLSHSSRLPPDSALAPANFQAKSSPTTPLRLEAFSFGPGAHIICRNHLLNGDSFVPTHLHSEPEVHHVPGIIPEEEDNAFSTVDRFGGLKDGERRRRSEDLAHGYCVSSIPLPNKPDEGGLDVRNRPR